jgi:predicted ATP-grasp superfamily ATP-dependent carboligase
MRVLVLGARSPVCLEWCRAFQKTGAQVWAADSLRWPVTRFSNSIQAYVRLPSPVYQRKAWFEALQKTITELKIDLLIPTCEEVFFLAYHLEQLSSLCQIPISRFELLHTLHHKGWFAQLSQTLPIQTPETLLLERTSALSRFENDGEQWVFKPAYSRFATRTLIQPCANELARLIVTPEQPWVAQRYVNGQEVCSYSVFHQGELTAHVCYEPQYRVGKGSGIYIAPVNHPQIMAFVTAFGRMYQFHGQVGFDFIYNQDQYHVLECNPRATSGLHLLNEDALAMTRTVKGSTNQVLTNQAGEPRMMSAAMLLFGSWQAKLKRPFWQDFQAAKDFIADKNDPHSFWSQPASLLELSFRAICARKNLLEISTDDIAWDGQAFDGG